MKINFCFNSMLTKSAKFIPNNAEYWTVANLFSILFPKVQSKLSLKRNKAIVNTRVKVDPSISGIEKIRFSFSVQSFGRC